MFDFLYATPNISIVIGAMVVLAVLWFIQLFIDYKSGHAWPIWLAMALIAFYLLWHGGAWLVARFLDTVLPYGYGQ